MPQNGMLRDTRRQSSEKLTKSDEGAMAETWLITGGAGNLACQLTYEVAHAERRVGHGWVEPAGEPLATPVKR